MESGSVIFHINSDPEMFRNPPKWEELDDSVRFIRYDLGSDFLKLRTVGARYFNLML
jgi:hypothetical protein